MGLDVSLCVLVGHKVSDFFRRIEVREKQFPRRDEITGEVIPGETIIVYYTYLITNEGTEILVGEKRKDRNMYGESSKILVDWQKVFTKEAADMINHVKGIFSIDEFILREVYESNDVERMYFGLTLQSGSSHRSNEKTGIVIDEEKAEALKKELKPIFEKVFPWSKAAEKTPKIIAFNNISY